MLDIKSLVINGQAYTCTPLVDSDAWAFPVGHHQQYPPEAWYVSVFHDLTGKQNNGYKHTGIDINLYRFERGDVERRLGLTVYAVADGLITHVTQDWYGVPMLVLEVLHEGKPLWIRYGHIIPCVMIGETVKAGARLGPFANWTGGDGGDHLHFDVSTVEYSYRKNEWLTGSELNPVDILKAHLSPARVDAMVAKG